MILLGRQKPKPSASCSSAREAVSDRVPGTEPNRWAATQGVGAEVLTHLGKPDDKLCLRQGLLKA